MACNLNTMLALMSDPRGDIVEDGLEDVAKRYEWPNLNSWTNFDFCEATAVLIELYRLGEEDIPTLSALMRKIGIAVASKRKVRTDARRKELEESKKRKRSKPKQKRVSKVNKASMAS